MWLHLFHEAEGRLTATVISDLALYATANKSHLGRTYALA